MDSTLSPPPRLHALSSTPISSKAARAQIESFLEDYQARSIGAKAADTALVVQLDKLSTALYEERQRKRAEKSA
ncbi:hypothetical protein PLEOSDRAFT_1042747 [Pleurotus ostreatus PC15]|uniref:Uncharacterized protein n=1 Tax=Pleurotus ostreatus (strain PC15) TaxID=1137138 RepID=A0A067NEB0_PLEO1|nr:hypothetical protein PLEOSDRAFT_1042747 [Pleurotus ostreatus PC15]